MQTKLFWTLLASFCLIGTVQGSIIPADPGVVGPPGGPYIWPYGMDLTSGSQIKDGDFVTIYGFEGLIAGTEFAPAGWTATSALFTPAPVGVSLLIPDDARPDLQFVWHGPTIVNAGPGSLFLGFFGAQSVYQDAQFSLSAYQNHDNTHPNGLPATGQNEAPTSSPTPQVPEPSTFVLSALAFGFLGLIVRRRRRATA